MVSFIVDLTSGSKGLTLPVWVTASVKAAAEVLLGQPFVANQKVFLPDQQKSIVVPVKCAELILEGTVWDNVYERMVEPERERDPEKLGSAVLVKVERAEDLTGSELDLD